jgi:hypothetical protein
LFARFTPRRLVRPPFRGVKLLLSGRKHKIFRAVSAGQRLVFKRVHDFTADDLLVRLLVHFEAVVVVVVFLFLLLGVFFFSLVWFSDGCETRTERRFISIFGEKKWLGKSRFRRKRWRRRQRKTNPREFTLFLSVLFE